MWTAVRGGAVSGRLSVPIRARLYPKLDRVTLLYLEHLARQHIRTHQDLKDEAQAARWAECGETLVDAVEAWRQVVRPHDLGW